MVQVLFYHMTRSTVDETVATLATRALGAGWRVMLRGTDAERLDWLDQKLWLGAEDDFLPHGLAGGDHDADQPVLLGTGPMANAAQALLLVDGARPLPGEAAGLERIWVLFDGQDGGAVADARRFWKEVVAQSLPAQYWSDEGGRWEKKAEKVPA